MTASLREAVVSVPGYEGISPDASTDFDKGSSRVMALTCGLGQEVFKSSRVESGRVGSKQLDLTPRG